MTFSMIIKYHRHHQVDWQIFRVISCSENIGREQEKNYYY